MSSSDPDPTARRNLNRRIYNFLCRPEPAPTAFQCDRLALAIDHLEDGTYPEGEGAMLEVETIQTRTPAQVAQLQVQSEPVTLKELRERLAGLRIDLTL